MKRKINIKKNIRKRTRNCFNQYINGTKGAVSLLLALVMSPLLSIALLLVESARYQDAIQLMDEIIDISAFSALAEYDSYLDERFGLLAVSQDTNIHEIFEDYLNNNSTAIGSSVSINSASASGEFALSDTGVLKQQMLEYSEIMVASEVAIEGIDLEHWLEELEKALDLKEFNDDIDAINAGIELTTTLEKLLEGIIELKEQYSDKYVPALSAYESAYSDFEDKASDLITALSNMEDSAEEDEGVNTAISNLENAADDYQNAASDLKSEYSALQGKIETVLSAVDSLPSKLQSFENKVAKPSLADECTTSTYEWLKIVADQVTKTFNDTVGADFKDKSTEEIQALDSQITKLNLFSANAVTSSWDTEKVKSEYGFLTFSVNSTLSENIDSLISYLNERAAVEDEKAVQMNNFLDIAGELLGISGLYDANLDSIVDTSYLYNDTSMSRSSQLSVSSLTDLISACEDFVKGITSLNIIEAVKSLGELLKAVVEFLKAVIAWVGEIGRNLLTYITSGPTEWYNGLLLYGYGAYNTPNRTTYSSKKTLSGFSYDKVYELAGGINRKATLTGSLGQLSTIGNTAGSDKLFKGAETEYLLVGSTSELQNQSVAFFYLYLLRLVLDIVPIFKNEQVSAIAATAGPGAWVVKLAIVLAEPMLDTIILVNNGKEYLTKDTVYFSYSGLVILEKDLVGITSISKNLQDKIKDTIEAHNGKPEEKAKIEIDLSYTEHMLILLMLSVNQTTYMQRMQNLIQLEGAAKNDGFQINNAYTYIYSDVTYTLNPMLDIDSLTENGLFTKKSEQYCGY